MAGRERVPVNAVIVVPTIREESIQRFLDLWKAEFADQVVIVVEDNPEKTFDLGSSKVIHYSWREVDAEMGDDADLIPRRSDGVRSFGFLKALDHDPDMIVTLDDDCYPDDDRFLETHWSNLQGVGREDAWVSTIGGWKPRGVPFTGRERAAPIALSHGLWSNVPDLDAPTQLAWQETEEKVELVDQVIPRGKFFPMCGMNLAFRPELVSCLYFLKMGEGQPFDRFGDIWAGIFAKRVLDHLGLGVWSGRPVVRHDRASDVWTNLAKEMTGLKVNETMWRAVDAVVLTSSTPADCYRELADKLVLDGPYWQELRSCMIRWADRLE